jgi:hypothetical protein
MKSINTFNPGPQMGSVRNTFISALRNRISVLILMCLLGCSIVSAQTTVTISGGNNAEDDQAGPGAYNQNPPNHAYNSTVSLYRGTGTTDLTTWGYISGLAWNYGYELSTPSGSYNLPIAGLWLNTFAGSSLTNNTTFATYTSGATNVFSGSLTCGASDDTYFGLTLTTPWLLPASTNFLVIPEVGSQTANDMYFYCDAYTNLAAWYGGSSAPVAGTTYGNYGNRASMQVTFAKPGITTQPATTASFCATTGSTTLTIASSNTTSYQWQYSPNNGTWTNIVAGTPAGSAYTPGTTAPALAATGSLAISGITTAGTYYYRCIVNNGNGASSTVTSVTCTLTVTSNTAAPATQATGVTFSSVTASGMTINWTNGNGAGRSVFMFVGSTGNPAPVNGTAYTGNVAFQSGTQIGATGWYCIYSGTGSGPITVSNLAGSTTYNIQVCEYNTGTCSSPAYNTAAAANNPKTQATIAACTAPSSVALSGFTTPICPGNSPGTFTATPSGGSPTSYTYLWYLNGASTGITTQTYAPGNLNVNATVYCAASTGTTCTTNSGTQTITVNTPNVTNTAPGTVTTNGATINGTD